MHGLYLLWWVAERQMPAAVVAAVLAAGDLAVMLIELPTGWFADKYGHKTSLVAGSAMQVAGMLACWLGQGIPGLLAASVLVAFGDAFRSGAREALLYRSCVALKREPAFQAIDARADALEALSLVGLVLAGGAIVNTFGFAAGWIAETMLCAIGVVLACAMTEPPPAPASTDDSPNTRAGLLTIRMALLVLPAAALGAAASAGSFLVQTAGGGTVVGITAFVAAAAIAEATGSWLAVRVPAGSARTACAEATAPKQQIAIAGVGSMLIAVALTVPAAFQPAVLALALLSGLAHPLRAAAIQRLARDDARARAASLASACDMALSTAVVPLAGLWRRR